MKITPYLIFNGQCEEAFKFYEKVLNGKIEFMQTHRNSPAANDAPADWQDKIIHTFLTIGEQELMASDAPPGHYQTPQGTCVCLQVDTTEEAERIYKALSENGTIYMPLEKTFWAERFAMFADRFGTQWMINYSNCDD